MGAASKEPGRPRLNVLVLTEIYEKEARNIVINKEFYPNMKAVGVTPKFYARHETIDLNSCDPDFLHMVEMSKCREPRQIWDEPQLTSHEYGWYREPLIHHYLDDERLHFPHRNTPISEYGAEMLKFKLMMR